MAQPEPLVRVVRTGLEESVHGGHVAVFDSRGRCTAWAGDPERTVFSRSSMKPLQASVSISVAGDDDLTLSEIAVMCASHNGEPVHVETVERVLRRARVGDSSLDRVGEVLQLRGRRPRSRLRSLPALLSSQWWTRRRVRPG